MAKGQGGKIPILLPQKARGDRRAADRRKVNLLAGTKADRRQSEDRRKRARREADRAKRTLKQQKQEQVRRRVIAAIKQKNLEKQQKVIKKEEEQFVKAKKKSKELIHYKKYQDEKKRLALSYAFDYGLDPNTPLGQRLAFWQQEVHKARINLLRAKKIRKWQQLQKLQKSGSKPGPSSLKK